MSLWEATMIFCFGISWPVAIRKSLTAPSVEGKSRLFLIIILIGYIAGIIHKLLFSLDWVLALYVINLLMVAADLVIVLVRRRRAAIRPGGA